MALKNGIKEENYIVIDCRKSELEFIKNEIIKSRLTELFDLNKVDWLKVEEFALSNLVKKVCGVWNDNVNKHVNTLQISKIVKLNRSTVTRYLKQGAKLGWCNYNEKEESLKGSKLIRKPLEIFKNGTSLGIFESASELSRQSEELFGVKLNHRHISNVCNGYENRKQHKGFTFKYIAK